MNPARETYFFSTEITGHGVITKHYIPYQVDGRVPPISEYSNVIVTAAEVGADGVTSIGAASIQVLNVCCGTNPFGNAVSFIEAIS